MTKTAKTKPALATTTTHKNRVFVTLRYTRVQALQCLTRHISSHASLSVPSGYLTRPPHTPTRNQHHTCMQTRAAWLISQTQKPLSKTRQGRTGGNGCALGATNRHWGFNLPSMRAGGRAGARASIRSRHSIPSRSVFQGKNKHMRMIKIQTLCPPRFFPFKYTVDAMTPRNH